MLSAFILGAVLPGLLAYACFSDLFSMTLSNRLCLAVVGCFGVFAAVSGMPLSAIGWHMLAGLAVFAVVFGMFAAGWIGGGDAKFVVGLALWMGFGQLAEFLTLASILGGMLTIALLWFRQYPLPQAVCRLPWALHLHHHRTGVPYGIALGVAALIVLPHSDIWRLGH